jgi:hypothetical protein
MAAMVPSSQHRHIQQLANMLRDRSMSLKLENIIVFTIYWIAILRHDELLMRGACVCRLPQQAALRVSYSQRMALRE